MPDPKSGSATLLKTMKTFGKQMLPWRLADEKFGVNCVRWLKQFFLYLFKYFLKRNKTILSTFRTQSSWHFSPAICQNNKIMFYQSLPKTGTSLWYKDVHTVDSTLCSVLIFFVFIYKEICYF
jgi:hypothetical protein